MALISCSECGNRISDKANGCPQCGNPVRQPESKPEVTTIEATGKQWKGAQLKEEITLRQFISVQLIALVICLGYPAFSNADVISAMCSEKWGNRYEMVNYCIRNHRSAKRELSRYSGSIRQNCERKWGNNFEMGLYCTKNQTAAKASVGNTTQDEVSRFCKNKWGNNYEMVEYCIKNQRAAKESIERSYSGYKRSHCKQQWGVNYEMVEYCIKN